MGEQQQRRCCRGAWLPRASPEGVLGGGTASLLKGGGEEKGEVEHERKKRKKTEVRREVMHRRERGGGGGRRVFFIFRFGRPSWWRHRASKPRFSRSPPSPIDRRPLETRNCTRRALISAVQNQPVAFPRALQRDGEEEARGKRESASPLSIHPLFFPPTLFSLRPRRAK